VHTLFGSFLPPPPTPTLSQAFLKDWTKQFDGTHCIVFTIAEIFQNVMIQSGRVYLSCGMNSCSLKRHSCDCEPPTILFHTKFLNSLKDFLQVPHPPLSLLSLCLLVIYLFVVWSVFFTTLHLWPSLLPNTTWSIFFLWLLRITLIFACYFHDFIWNSSFS
jgi:hypothetical protein